MTDASFEGTIPNFEALVESAIESALENLNADDWLDGVNLNQYIDFDSIVYDYDIVTNDSAYEIARDAISEDGNGGTDIYSLNEMLGQVAEGRDCSDGNPFREAVKAIVNAQILTGGTGASDGTIMTLKANGEEREIQAILTRRREYFDALTSRLAIAFEHDLRFQALPSEWADADGDTGYQRYHKHYQREVDDRKTGHVHNMVDAYQRVEVNGYAFDRMKEQLHKYGQVAAEAVALVALLRTLHDGGNGQEAVRNATHCKEEAQYSIENSIKAEPTSPNTETNDSDE